MLYDVACRFKLFIKKLLELLDPTSADYIGECLLLARMFIISLNIMLWADLMELLALLVFAIPGMHVYAHVAECQYTMGAGVTELLGQVDGENVERLWAVLNPFAGMASRMRLSTYVDLFSYILRSRNAGCVVRVGRVNL